MSDVFCLVCDGLMRLPDVVGNVWPLTTVQTCIMHLIRNTFRLTSRRDWDPIKKLIRPIYGAVNESAARAASSSAEGSGLFFVTASSVVITAPSPLTIGQRVGPETPFLGQSHAEIYFTPTTWPAFTERGFARALHHYARARRRSR